ncbi:DUF3301 domain-containing protein [Marinomonas sp. 15G1-11]|uniref:DUF3301 domain-containing protein n=1 Tax=Marinomonas phaeophyticola TaxID=3004091 RepID=A0ABT4JQ83_9GAMM|nr:DUF3301 domain-containing protein [Marinomonas sp. 15G1-11]MCZ2720523.1 DUF3301 domain-containing protein [Marinomonas sp. 15G1-11]
MHIELIDIVIFVILGSIAYFWWNSNSIRELAFSHVKAHCKKHEVQLLDQSVALHKWKVTWSTGQLKVLREYQFEFTSTGEARYKGEAVLIGNTLMKIELSAYHI